MIKNEKTGNDCNNSAVHTLQNQNFVTHSVDMVETIETADNKPTASPLCRRSASDCYVKEINNNNNDNNANDIPSLMDLETAAIVQYETREGHARHKKDFLNCSGRLVSIISSKFS